MLLIDLEMPDRCETCPCVHMADGNSLMDEDYCQITSYDLEEDAERKRPEWCPLKEVKDGN